MSRCLVNATYWERNFGFDTLAKWELLSSKHQLEWCVVQTTKSYSVTFPASTPAARKMRRYPIYVMFQIVNDSVVIFTKPKDVLQWVSKRKCPISRWQLNKMWLSGSKSHIICHSCSSRRVFLQGRWNCMVIICIIVGVGKCKEWKIAWNENCKEIRLSITIIYN